jgi:hypothetical protein
MTPDREQPHDAEEPAGTDLAPEKLVPVDTRRTVGRRDVVRLLGLTPLAGVLEWSGAEVERAARFVDALASDDSSQQFAAKFFTPAELRTVRILVDYVIPRDARSGSATDARVPEFMDFMYSDPEVNTSQGSRTALRNGLTWLDAECTRRFNASFVAATDSQRRQVLDDIAWPRRARPEMMDGVTFFNRFRDLTASGFYSSAIGWRDVQYLGNVAIPEWKGCPEPALRKLGVTYDLMNTRVPVQNGTK